MAAYATQAEFEAYVEGWVTDNPDALARLLERASRDVDGFLGPYRLIETGAYTGLKLDPANLTPGYRAALVDATCAMAEYRFDTTESEWAQAGKGGRVKGPDFETELPAGPGGGRPRLTPKVAAEIRRLDGIRILTANVR